MRKKGGEIETKEIENETAVGESASGKMEEGLAVRKEASMGRIGRRTGEIEISGIRKGISEVEDGSVASKNRGKEEDKTRKMKNEGWIHLCGQGVNGNGLFYYVYMYIYYK